MSDEEIRELVMKLSASWKNRLVFDTKPFEDEMVEMCITVRENTINQIHMNEGRKVLNNCLWLPTGNHVAYEVFPWPTPEGAVRTIIKKDQDE